MYNIVASELLAHKSVVCYRLLDPCFTRTVVIAAKHWFVKTRTVIIINDNGHQLDCYRPGGNDDRLQDHKVPKGSLPVPFYPRELRIGAVFLSILYAVPVHAILAKLRFLLCQEKTRKDKTNAIYLVVP